ncbi:hypothetical protein AGLY_014615 [Aphis glycines]|uniref:Uncharacterized protein n=1 Tax=Aphis glycines TaxID=307491 RepID=A0A6G0T2J0_APHGL|nr:hypothetical protein AGLY_014615 [Aphis glycines]
MYSHNMFYFKPNQILKLNTFENSSKLLSGPFTLNWDGECRSFSICNLRDSSFEYCLIIQSVASLNLFTVLLFHHWYLPSSSNAWKTVAIDRKMVPVKYLLGRLFDFWLACSMRLLLEGICFFFGFYECFFIHPFQIFEIIFKCCSYFIDHIFSLQNLKYLVSDFFISLLTSFFDCPWKTSRTYNAPRANPNTLFVSLIQYRHGCSPPSDPNNAFHLLYSVINAERFDMNEGEYTTTFSLDKIFLSTNLKAALKHNVIGLFFIASIFIGFRKHSQTCFKLNNFFHLNFHDDTFHVPDMFQPPMSLIRFCNGVAPNVSIVLFGSMQAVKYILALSSALLLLIVHFQLIKHAPHRSAVWHRICFYPLTTSVLVEILARIGFCVHTFDYSRCRLLTKESVSSYMSGIWCVGGLHFS